MSFIADKFVMDGLTYDDVLLIPPILRYYLKLSNSRQSFHVTLN